MRNVIAHTSLDDLVGQQAQAPAGMARWCVAAGQGGDFGALRTVNLDRSLIRESLKQTPQERVHALIARHVFYDEAQRARQARKR